MAVQYLQEQTEWEGDVNIPNHIYLVDGIKLQGYIKQGTTEIIRFKHPMTFDKRRRKFKELSLTALKAMGIK